jgi:deoxyribodipyrimidine photolyase
VSLEEIQRKFLNNYFRNILVYTNSSYNFQGKQRDSTLETLCKKHDISWLTFHDFLMIPPDVLPTRKVFTPFSLLWKKHIASINTTPQQTAIQGTEWVKIPEFQTPSDAF